MRLYLLILLVVAVGGTSFVSYDAYHDKIGINFAKAIPITYLGKTVNVNEGLNYLAGKTGTIKWSHSHITNSTTVR